MMKFNVRKTRSSLRRLIRVALVLPVVAVVGSSFFSPADAQQNFVDTLLVRPAQMVNGRISSIDDAQVVLDATPYQRAAVDWISLNGAGRYPRPVAEPMRVDVVQLVSGENVLGRLSAFSRASITVDSSPVPRVIPFDQVLSIVFCDNPCGVGIGIPIDPTLIASETQRLNVVPGAAVGAGIVPTATPALPGVVAGTPVPTVQVGDICRNDEHMTFAPQEPKVGDELLIAVSSAGRTQYPRLTGTEPATFQRERQGQLGWVYEWIVRPTWPGEQEYTFYVDSTVPCKTDQVEVAKQLRTPTPKPPR